MYFKINKKNFFRMTHDLNNHENFHRVYDRFVSSMFVKHLTKRLRVYIELLSIVLNISFIKQNDIFRMNFCNQ